MEDKKDLFVVGKKIRQKSWEKGRHIELKYVDEVSFLGYYDKLYHGFTLYAGLFAFQLKSDWEEYQEKVQVKKYHYAFLFGGKTTISDSTYKDDEDFKSRNVNIVYFQKLEWDFEVSYE